MVWERLAAQARELLDKFAPRLTVGSLDTLHVAAALVGGSPRFRSFAAASNARVLAAAARLAVWPELTAGEKLRLAR